ncbi:hypothetical protein B0J14DRAFT_654529 [Halenospora varia]|nr:hypothetical protein B0J14DRAFT_654529 [Halenospora varia]
MANHTHAHFNPFHVCMTEGEGYETSAIVLRAEKLEREKNAALREVQRLHAILDANNLATDGFAPPNRPVALRRRSSTKLFSKPQISSPATPQSKAPTRTLRSSAAKIAKQVATAKAKDEEDSRTLPTEVIVRIMKYVLTSKEPIIDPFFKLERLNITKEERSNREDINIHFLSTCKAFREEGTRLLIANNDFIFTQLAALHNFAQYRVQERSTINHIILRVVGRYYDEAAGKKDVSGRNWYHPKCKKLIVPVHPRPNGMRRDSGIQSYCWQQVTDFLKALSVLDHNAKPKTFLRVFPQLKRMRLDLVDFCEHLPFPGARFLTIVRWNAGRMLEELVISGCPFDEEVSIEEDMIRTVVKHGGVFSGGCAVFVSTTKTKGVKKLPGSPLFSQMIKDENRPKSKKEKSDKADKTGKTKTIPHGAIHPEGGVPPKSSFPAGRTVWKYTYTNLEEPRQWVEFDKRTGIRADDVAEIFDSDWECEDQWSDDEYLPQN